MISTKLTGDWDRLFSKLRSLPSDIKEGKQKGLQRVGDLTSETVKSHLANQDLGWKALSEETVKQKGSSTILIETGKLQSNIGTTQVNDNKIFIGAKQGDAYPSGASVNEVLKYHEFGTSKEPPRPLIQPSYDEIKPQAKQILREEIIDAIKR